MTVEKTIHTLIPDIKNLISEGKTDIDEDNIDIFLKAITNDLKNFLDPKEKSRSGYLRMSSIGREDRKIWYDVHNKTQVKHPPELLLKFFYGNIVEALMLFLAAESGHKVTNQQEEVKIEGITGHIDAMIDGAVVDVKSASTRAFRKFKTKTLLGNDPFGYIGQISAYMDAKDVLEGGFLAFDKSTGDITFMMVDELTKINATDRIKHLKEIISLDAPPERCYDPIPLGVQGNYTLSTGCSYCDFKNICWKGANDGSGLRVFQYSNGLKYFTHVEVEPKVEEITNVR